MASSKGASRLALAQRALSALRGEGARVTARRSAMWLGQHVLQVRPDLVQHRYALSERICREYDYTVQYGPFAGLKFSPDSSWSAADRGAMILGLYESHVLEELSRICDGRMPLVDLGAADGYYAIGALRSGLVPYAVCFEMSESGRQVIGANARLNGVDQSVRILGVAREDFLNQIPGSFWSESEPAVFLIDIEGEEFDLLSPAILAKLRNSYVIVELHEPMSSESAASEALMARAETFFNVRTLLSGPRNPSAFKELSHWCDDDRWLLMSESRAYEMRWLLLEPKPSLIPVALSSDPSAGSSAGGPSAGSLVPTHGHDPLPAPAAS